MKTTPRARLTRLETLQLALKAQADERSVLKVLKGGKLKGDALDKRVREVLKAAGLLAAMVLAACSSAMATEPTTGEPGNVAAKLIESLYVSGYGTAAASGTVTFYQVGTLTQATVFSDDALTQAQTQPITLDERGATPLPVYTATPLRAIVKSNAGATLQDIARIDGDRAELVGVSNTSFPASATVDAALTALGTSFGGTNGNFLATGSAAVARTFQSVISELWFSVKSFGAIGNGIADDTTAIQAAINAAQAAGGGVIYFPSGTYLISSALTVPLSATLLGQSPSATNIKNSNATGTAIALTGSASTVNATVRNMTISHSSASTQPGITALNGAGYVFDSVTILGHATSLSVAGAFMATNCVMTATGTSLSQATGGTGIVIGGGYTGTISISAGGNAMRVFGATVSGSTAGVDVTSGLTSLTAFGVVSTGAGVGLRVAAGMTGIIATTGCDWGVGVTDSRAGAPVNYVVSTTPVTITPLPLSTDAVRIIANAGAGTVNIGAITANGFGRKFTLICSNNSGGAITWTFNAQYVLNGAVAPATGNRVNLILEYNPIDNKIYEFSRTPTTN